MTRPYRPFRHALLGLLQDALQQALSEEKKEKRREKKKGVPSGLFLIIFVRKYLFFSLFALHPSLFSGLLHFATAPLPPGLRPSPLMNAGGQDSGCVLSFLTLQAPVPLPAKGINKIIWNQLTICRGLCIMYVEISDFPSAICQKPSQYSGF